MFVFYALVRVLSSDILAAHEIQQLTGSRMNHIKKIEINHFRSIHRLVINDLRDINVFSGSNDVGKSNVIKALNLFFENEIDWETQLDIERDTNTFHAHRSRWGKIRKSVSVKLTFTKPQVPRGRYPRLPDVFWIKRQWDRDYSVLPNTTWGAEGESKPRSNWQRGLTEFLNRSRFFYVPAVRSRGYLEYLLGQFLEVAIDKSDQDVLEAIGHLAEILETRTSDLREILYSVTGLKMALELPDDLLNVLRAVDVITEGNVPLQYRGDGIQSLIVPGLLEFLCGRGRNEFCYWGFEEPENSLEYRRASDFAQNLSKHYANKVQVFLTSHSPAFLSDVESRTSVFHVMQQIEDYSLTGHIEQTSRVQRVDPDDAELSEVLGLAKFSRDFGLQFIEKLNQRDRIVESQRRELVRIKRPRLLVEGKNDQTTLEYAWSRLYSNELPFEIMVAGDAKAVAHQISMWTAASEKPACALFDHDIEGIKAIGALKDYRKRGFIKDSSAKNIKYTQGDSVLAITLPSPTWRVKNLENHNLPMEYYFSDSVLLGLDRKPDSTIFSRTTYIKERKVKTESKSAIQALIDANEVTTVHRKIDGPGKERLVEILPELPDEEFAAFSSLFDVVITHLIPRLELTRRPNAHN